jgi:D-alanyl-lipoteichoic acid acyltransferase DltB (MBOAT superfamily)
MDVTSVQFIGFALLAAGLYHVSRAGAWRQAILLIANLVFMVSLSRQWKAYLPLLAFLAIGYAGIRLVQIRKSKPAFVVLLSGTIILFLWLKQYRFIPGSMFLPFAYFTVGLSYIFFRVLHMLIDAHDGSLKERVGVVQYLNYTLNFTTLIAGPIQMYPDYAAQAGTQGQRLTLERAAEATERIAIGFFKVRVLSMFMLAAHGAAASDLIHGQVHDSRLLAGCYVAVLYPIYLYLNFSGYCDMMIGLARFFGFDLPENFNRPFSSASFLEFWSRWHITLSDWLKTYVYTPMVKTLMTRFPSVKVEPFLGVFAFFVTFFLIGAWHGQTSEFLFYGVLLGLGISSNKLYQVLMAKWLGRKRFKSLTSQFIYRAFARGLTFTFFTFSLLWFWSSWQQMYRMASALGPVWSALVWLAIWLCATVILALWEALRNWSLELQWEGRPLLLNAPIRAAWATYLMAVTAVVLHSAQVPTPVLYRIF